MFRLPAGRYGSAVGAAELGPWTPLDVGEVAELFEPAPFRWWLAGGHALEAHLHRTWRSHDDIDIGIVRADAPRLFELLTDWDIHLASDGVLTPWDGRPVDGDLADVVNLWCRPTADAPWALDVLIGEGDSGEWIYKRDWSVRRGWDDTVLRTSDGVPYLAPEVQLLFKSRSARPKDEVDAGAVVPALVADRRSWLANQLPADHVWQSIIASCRAKQALSGQPDGVVDVELLAAGKSSQAWRVVDAEDQSVVRVPIPNSGRLLSYRSEERIGDLLSKAGHPVSRWETQTVEGVDCSIGTFLEGSPIAYDAEWSDQFAEHLASVLRDLHQLTATGWGPLANTSSELVGTSDSELRGVVDRWFHAPIWPFDGSDLTAHPVVDLEPELAGQIARLEGRILGAAGAPFGVLHSDLHQQHLLGSDGLLSGVLDFGDAFIGSTAWDFALIRWYYGHSNAVRLAEAYQCDPGMLERSALLALAVGCYKLAKTPHDDAARRRLRELLAPGEPT